MPHHIELEIEIDILVMSCFLNCFKPLLKVPEIVGPLLPIEVKGCSFPKQK